MNYPENFKYTKDHEWISTENGVTHIGITDFAQSELGEIVYVDVNTVGDTVEAGEVFGSIEAVKTVSDLFMPATAMVKDVNPALEEHPELVNEDPYGAGWLIDVELTDPTQLDKLMSAAEYRKWIGKE
ncbi:MAG: glycine cleavage system protein GcvH [Bacteroidales bacterium]